MSPTGGNYGGQFDTAAVRTVAHDFAAGRAKNPKANPKGERPAVVGIALPEKVVKRLIDQKLLKVTQEDFNGKPFMQYRFIPEAIKTLQEGFFFSLD